MNLASKLNQTAVRWAKAGVDANGNSTYAAGVQLTRQVRWEKKRKLFVNARGEKEVSQGNVYFDADVTAIVLDDKLFEGTLASLSASEQADPNLVREAYRVRGNDESRSVDASQGLRQVFL